MKRTGEGLASENLSTIDCATLRNGVSNIAEKNFLLPDDAVVGICVERDYLPTHVNFISPDVLKKFWKV